MPYFRPSPPILLPTRYQRDPLKPKVIFPLERGEADVRKMGFENAMKLCEVLRVTPYELMNAGDNSRKAHKKE